MDKQTISEAYKAIQDDICRKLEVLDGGAVFTRENWARDGGGGGESRILLNGALIEKGGVNFSSVHGQLPDVVKKSFGVDESEFFATGVSIVLHPHHPLVPVIHMNIRYFELTPEKRWFGGGIDLTPHYVFDEDARYFHQGLKEICSRFHPDFYSRFKTWADDYFYIRHRQETRGIGGIFYDRLTGNDEIGWEQLFDFSLAVGNYFAPVYSELAGRHREKAFTEAEKEWQYIRRSRYAEFNLVYDSGTKFGLETNGRIESILMSLPPMASWVYNHQPEPGTPEAETLGKLKKGIAWV
ncbi:MAG: oxygen-dependent coproporphyrinogen oxidase [Mucilaginibacter polytrichastri]|nr:oxygen-dependent coproporphyrinogen oxidase [Mucilaginibacter polytrichastri]